MKNTSKSLSVRHTGSFVSALLFSTAICSVVYAQAEQGMAENGENTEVSSDDDAVVSYEEIVITAQRRQQSLGDVPISVQAVTGEALSRSVVTSSSDLAKISASLNFTEGYSPSATSIVIRGAASISQEGGVQPSVGVVIDGVPTARQAEFIVDLADIERIEILSGPQGTLFGKNSTAGVVNIVTKRPEHEFLGEVEAGITTDEEYLLKAMVNLPVNDKLALRVNGFYRNLEPLVKNPSGIDDLGSESYGIQGKALFEIGDSTDFLFTANYNHVLSTFGQNFVIVPISGALGDFQRLVFGHDFGRGNTEINHDGSAENLRRFFSFTGELNTELTDSWQLTSVTGYRDFFNNNSEDIENGPTGATNGVRSPNPLDYPIEYIDVNSFLDKLPEHYKYFSQEFRLAYSDDALDAIIGVYYQNYREKRSGHNQFVFDGSYVQLTPGVKFYSHQVVRTKLRDDTIAIFGDATYKFSPTISVFGGLRYTHEKVELDYAHQSSFNLLSLYDFATNVNTGDLIEDVTDFDERSDNNLSGRAGLQWQPTDELNYYASYSRGYKGPAANQGHSANTVTDKLIDPEIAEAFEIGAKQRFLDGALAVDVAVFTQKISNIQQVAVLPNSINTRLINAGDLKITGFEGNVRAHLSNNFLLSGSVAYTDAKYDGGFFACNPSQTAGVTPCVIDNNNDGTAETQSLTGQQAIGSPKWKVVISGDYNQDLDNGMRVFANVSYNWRSSVQFQLGDNPLTREPSYGLLDASIGLAGEDDQWQIILYGKNLGNQFYYSQVNAADFIIGQQFGNIPRDFKRYGGVRLKVQF